MPDDDIHTISTSSSSFVELSGLFVELSGLVVELSGLVVELSGLVVELSGLVVELSGLVVELSGFVELLLSSLSLGVVCVVSSEGSVGSEGGEVSTPTKNNATDNMIATIALMFFFCNKVKTDLKNGNRLPMRT